MKRPLAYITAAWSGNDCDNTETAARYCRQVYHLMELLKEKGIDLICTDENLTPDLSVTRL